MELYGFFINEDGRQLMYHIGLFESEDDILEYARKHFPNTYIEIDTVNVIPDSRKDGVE